MCGIAGIVRFDEPGISAGMLSQLSNQLRHRGPDDHGFVGWSPRDGAAASRDAGVADHRLLGLATRRLAILDLSDAGAQPMESDDGRFWIAYNGEVYNYVELRCDLEKLGCRFRSTSDTEVVLRALQRWGRAALQRFTGMFALAFFDAATGELLLARAHTFVGRFTVKIKPASASLFVDGHPAELEPETSALLVFVLF